MSKKHTILVADPPWNFKDSLSMSDVKRGADANYGTMTIEQIKRIPIKDIASPDGALLALWVPSSLLQEGLDVMREWGFKHKQTYIWVKSKKQVLNDLGKWVKKNILKEPQNTYDKLTYAKAIDSVLKSLSNVNLTNELSFGMGRLFRQTHEICLIGINNNKIYKHLSNKSQRSVSFGENLKHSAKPEHLQDSLELMFPNSSLSKVEIFARRQKLGWICLGNQCPMTKDEDINISLQKLINISDENYDSLNKLLSSYSPGDTLKLSNFWQKLSLK